MSPEIDLTRFVLQTGQGQVCPFCGALRRGSKRGIPCGPTALDSWDQPEIYKRCLFTFRNMDRLCMFIFGEASVVDIINNWILHIFLFDFCIHTNVLCWVFSC